MKAKEVRDKYKCVSAAIETLRQEAFKVLMNKNEDYGEEEINYNAIARVDTVILNNWLHICVIVSRNPGAEAERTYIDELKATMDTVSEWLTKADTPAGKRAYAKCLRVLVGAYIIEMKSN